MSRIKGAMKMLSKNSLNNDGFTLIEIIAVVVIIAIAALLALPMMSSASGTQLRAAADMIAADIEYAKSMAISRQKPYTVIFDTASDSYSVKNESGVVIAHPAKAGFQYIVNFKSDSRLNKVDIVEANFGSSNRVAFTYPYLGSPANGGVVTLSTGMATLKVNVEPVTGFVSITQ